MKNYLGLFLLLTIPLSLIFWIPMYFITHGRLALLAPYIIIFSTLGALSPIFSLLMIEKVSKKEIQIKIILKQAKLKNSKKIWLILACIMLPLIAIISMILNKIYGFNDEFRIFQEGPDNLGLFLMLIIPIHFAAGLLTSPLFEEPGWRGFALGELQKKMPRDLASLFLGTYWWLWHQGMNFAFDLYPTFYGYLTMVAMSFIFDAMYNLSDKNLLSALFNHSASLIMTTYFYVGNENWFYFGLLVIIAMILRIIENKRSVCEKTS